MAITTGTLDKHDVRTQYRGSNLISVEVTLGATPALSDDAKHHFSAISRTAAGKFKLTPRKRWAKILGVGANLLGEVVEFAKIYDVTDGGSAANEVLVGTFAESTGTNAFADPAADRTCVVTVVASTHVDRI